MSLAVATARLLLLCGAALTPLPCLAIPAEGDPPPELRLNDPKPTTVLVRVVGHGAMVLGREVGSARVTINDAATNRSSPPAFSRAKPATRIKSCGRAPHGGAAV
jgi:hypothetical protein